jgi:hypothetical protein
MCVWRGEGFNGFNGLLLKRYYKIIFIMFVLVYMWDGLYFEINKHLSFSC